MAKPWSERPVSAANKSGKQEVTQWNVAPIRARSKSISGRATVRLSDL